MVTESALRYAAFYCEENVWWLAQEPRFEGRARHAVFITNASRSVAMFAQRAGRGPARAVAWDYHVVLAVSERDGRAEIWDLDCVLGAPLAFEDWLDACFAPEGALPPELEPRFRIVAADRLIATFASDRSHMRRADGSWRRPPPAWPAIGTGPTNLERFLDVSDAGLGEVLELARLRDRFRR